MVEAAEPQVLGTGSDDPVLHSLATELPNLRAALERAAVTDPNAGLRLVNALTLFWLFTGRYREGDTAYARALDAAGEEPTPLRSGRGPSMIVGVSVMWSGRCGKCSHRPPGVDHLVDPGPVGAQMQPPFALPAGQPGGQVQQPVAQQFRGGVTQLALGEGEVSKASEQVRGRCCVHCVQADVAAVVP
jgi:hypothetical protein